MKLFEGAEHANIYGQIRPSYPKELVQTIIEFVGSENDSFDFAIDVGCGSGQATQLFSSYFKRIYGFDVSENQIKEAKRLNNNEKISFFVSPSETLPVDNETVDLISVAAALHWFEISAFFTECKRIIKPNGTLAVFFYSLPKISRSVRFEARIEEAHIFLKPYFAKNVFLNETRFKSIDFPFRKVERDISFKNEMKWKVDHLIQFVQTLSAYQTFCSKHAENNFIETLRSDLLQILKEDENEKMPENIELKVDFKVTLILCRK